MKKRLFAAIICMILVFSMMPVGVFAEGSGSMERGLYWRKTRLSQDDEGHVIFLPTDDDYSKDLIEGSTGGSSNVLEFFYVDDSGEKHHLKCSDLDFQGDICTVQPLPSGLEDPSIENMDNWSLVDINFNKEGTGAVIYNSYKITLVGIAEPDYEFYTYDKETGKPGEILDGWNWNEDNKTICFAGNTNKGTKVRNIEEYKEMSNLNPVFSPDPKTSPDAFPAEFVTITLEEEPKEEELFIKFNDGPRISVTIHVTGGNTGDPGLFWHAADETDWGNEPITGKCGDGTRYKFIFRDEHGEHEVLKEDFSTTATFFEWVTDGPGVNFDFTTAGNGELIYKEDTNYKVPIVVEHKPTDSIVENEVAATCKAEGSYDEVIYCKGCDAEISRTKKTIEKLAHTPVEAIKENEVAATCKEEGSYDEVVYCSECKEEISRTKKTIEKLSHTPAEAVKENEVAATCKAEGAYDEVIYCSECKEEISRETKTIAKLTEHSWGEWFKNEAGTEQTRTCSVCGETETEAISSGGNGGGGHSGGSTPRPSEPSTPAASSEPTEDPAKDTVTVDVTDPATGETVQVEVPKAAVDAANQFEDVEPTDYFAEAVGYAAENGITAGVSAGKFGPAKDCTRGQVVTFLWTARGKSAPEKTSGFADITGSAYYADAVAWAVENGITAGTSETQFSPNRTVTRGQFITMLWISLGKPEVDTELPFVDVPEDAYYAKAVAWAYANGITAGKSATAFGADDPCTRGQIVTFLYNAIVE